MEQVRELSLEEKIEILEEIKREYEAAETLTLNELKSRALKMMNDFLNDRVDRDFFTHQFRIIDSNVKRILDAQEDCIEMNSEWPLWLFGFCNHYFNVWSRIDGLRMKGAVSEKDYQEAIKIFKDRIREALPK